MAKPLDFSLLGKKFGRLTILEFLPEKGKITKVRCICECGKECITQPLMVKRGTTTSCGCYRKEFCLFNRTNNPPIRRKKEGEAAFNSFYKMYKDSAKVRNLEFLLTKEEFKEITSKNCYYCSAKPIKQKEKNCFGGYLGNGIDRKDNKKGYNIENCLPCCNICNRAKLDLKYEQFMEWINNLKRTI